MVAATVQVKTSGPFFTPGMPQLVEQALDAGVRELTERAEEKLQVLLRPRPAGVFHSGAYAASHGYTQTGRYRQGVSSEFRSLLGRVHDSNSTYGPWLEGDSSRNTTTRFPGYHTFRRVGNEAEDEAPRVLGKHVKGLVRRLNGGI